MSAVLSRPPWLGCAAFAAVGTAAVCWPSWPGFMSYDSLLAYQQAVYGVQTALWPPMQTYMFVVSRTLGANIWGAFLFQTFIVLFGAAITIHLLTARRLLAWVLTLLFAGGLVFFPVLIGTMQANWKDVSTAGFALVGFGLWIAAARTRSIPLLALSILSMCLSVALRYNAFILLAPAMLAMAWRPFLDPGRQGVARGVAIALIVLGLTGAWASTTWRLPDLLKMPSGDTFAGTQEFDVIGISACSGVNYLPRGMVSAPMTVAQIRQAYDPRHLLLTLQPRPGAPRILEGNAGGKLGDIWWRLLTTEPGCYLAHRNTVFVEQMGLAKEEVFYPIHGGIDVNPFGLKLARPDAAQAVVAYVTAHASQMPRRPILLYGLAVVFGLAAVLSRRQPILMLALLAGALGYPAVLFLVGPAADARYIFPSNVLCLVIALASIGLLAGPGRRA